LSKNSKEIFLFKKVVKLIKTRKAVLVIFFSINLNENLKEESKSGQKLISYFEKFLSLKTSK